MIRKVLRKPRRHSGRQIIRVAATRPASSRAAVIVADSIFACAVGDAGLRRRKREGDRATPRGSWPLRRLFYRADRRPRPSGGLATTPIRPSFGWCDDPRAPAYNQLIGLPSRMGHEVLWRDDPLYDVVVVIGYNDRPPDRGKGSAIFIHLAGPGLAPTRGCIAMAPRDLARLVTRLRPGAKIII